MTPTEGNVCLESVDCTSKTGIDRTKLLKPSRLVLYGLGLILFLFGIMRNPDGWAGFMVFASAYLIFGSGVLLAAIRNVIHGKIFDENFLMSIATLGAFAIGEYPEGVAVMVFYQVGEYLQDSALYRSRRSIEQLMEIRPDYANLLEAGKTRRVNPEEVSIGSVIVVKPGERIPLDGEVIKGSSALDLSALTGESLPREVSEGDQVLSGSVNKSGLIEIRVSTEYSQSTVSRILSLVENAASRKAKTEQFITRFAAYYTPLVVISALLLAVIPPLVISGQDFSTWAYRALIFLVISCPCALVVSIPLSFFGGIGGASRKGILVKGGNYLEALSHVDTVIFDKTGTLTHGYFTVKDVQPATGFSHDDLLRYGAAAAHYSSHPLSVSIREAAITKPEEMLIASCEELPGRGVKINYNDQLILMGNQKLLSEHDIEIGDDSDHKTRVHLAIDGRYAGSITLEDELKDDAVSAVQELRRLGIKQIIMLSGDKQQVAEEIGRKLKLDRVYAELLPDQKVEIIENLEKQKNRSGKNVFVGDGINDAPSLARAEIGVAMGGVASDAALEAADIVLMTGQPSKLAEAVAVARKTRAIVFQNIVLALGVKAVVMGLGLFGLASMWEAVFADVGVALLAVLNAMRAMR
ncbi:MAG: cadmium-translocating P-type ATPase [Firmicutes bacterium]|nr:cadmium-translocating P-type ATPase [Bacillota bacterium]